jgi:uncharacterized protein (TIGR03083 family)
MSLVASPEEIADRWVDSRSRVREFIAGTSADQHDRNVLGTPKWSVIELMGHVVGSPIDLANGKFDGAGGPQWTQAQVEERRGRSLAELLDEWDGAAGRIVDKIRAGEIPAPVAYDVITHEQDLRGALGLEPLPDPRCLAFITDGLAARLVRAVEAAALPPVRLVDPESGWTAGEDGGVTVSGSQFEFFRAMTGRRSKAQVAAMGWSADPSPYLAVLSPFGALRDDDVHD